MYSNKQIQNRPENFPPPMNWLLWIEGWAHVSRPLVTVSVTHEDGSVTQEKLDNPDLRTSGQGKIRYYATLALAKRNMSWISRKTSKWDAERYAPEFIKKWSGAFRTNWSIYEWVDGEWVERYSGKQGERRNTNPLYRLKIDKDGRVHPLDKVREQEAMEILHRTLERASA